MFTVEYSTKFQPSWTKLEQAWNGMPDIEMARRRCDTLHAMGMHVRVVDEDGTRVHGQSRSWGEIASTCICADLGATGRNQRHTRCGAHR